jgi:hypothetical protein
MHDNERLIAGLFEALNKHDHIAIAKYYAENAYFEDIAFNLRGRKEIHAMWHLICATDISVTVEALSASGSSGKVTVIEKYTFTDTGRPVVNKIEGRFVFRDGLIMEHHDTCDPLAWARQAFGGVKGELAGRLGFLRGIAARKKIAKMKEAHPEYC